VVFDTVYNPLMTPLLLAARDRGLGVITGDRMFIDQAARQFQLWTGGPAPRALMERVLRETLAG
jgi:3-dehydroquinate dehydratase/shikimate dehydrogenase